LIFLWYGIEEPPLNRNPFTLSAFLAKIGGNDFRWGKTMRGLSILLLFQLAGTVLERAAHLPLPGNVIGLILLLGALLAGWVKLEWVEDTAARLLKHMMLFFAPLIVAAVALLPLFGREWAAVAASLFLGTAATIVVTALTAKLWPGAER
jgi:holin-like protein